MPNKKNEKENILAVKILRCACRILLYFAGIFIKVTNKCDLTYKHILRTLIKILITCNKIDNISRHNIIMNDNNSLTRYAKNPFRNQLKMPNEMQ